MAYPACDKCGVTPDGGVALFRVNPKGEVPSINRCRRCGGGTTDGPLDRLVEVIENPKLR